MKYVLPLLVAAALQSHAYAGGCGQLFRTYHAPVYHAPYVAPVKIQQNIFYKVGEALELRSIIRQELESVKAELRAQHPEPLKQSTGILSAKCARCHNGSGAFDIAGGLDDAQFRRWVEMAGQDIDVPSAMKPVLLNLRNANELGAVTDALIALPRAVPDGVLLPKPAARTEPEVGVLE